MDVVGLMPLLDDLMRRDGDAASTLDARAIEALASHGCRWEGALPGPVTFLEAGLGVWADYLRWATSCQTVEVYRETTSTQDAARRWIDSQGSRRVVGTSTQSNPVMALILADHQQSGRGRLGRHWRASPGSAVLMSLVIPAEAGSAERLNLAAAVAVAEAVDACHQSLPAAGSTAIKWPNDVMRDGRKLAGVLVETVQHQGQTLAIVGIGINVMLSHDDLASMALAEAGLEQRVTSVVPPGRMQPAVHRLALAADVVNGLTRLHDLSDESLGASWRQRCHQLGGAAVSYRHQGQTIRGTPMDVDPKAGLILRTESGEILRLPSATTTAAID